MHSRFHFIVSIAAIVISGLSAWFTSQQAEFAKAQVDYARQQTELIRKQTEVADQALAEQKANVAPMIELRILTDRERNQTTFALRNVGGSSARISRWAYRTRRLSTNSLETIRDNFIIFLIKSDRNLRFDFSVYDLAKDRVLSPSEEVHLMIFRKASISGEILDATEEFLYLLSQFGAQVEYCSIRNICQSAKFNLLSDENLDLGK